MLLRIQKRKREESKEGETGEKERKWAFFLARVGHLQKIQIEGRERVRSELCDLDNACCIFHSLEMPWPEFFVCLYQLSSQTASYSWVLVAERVILIHSGGGSIRQPWLSGNWSWLTSSITNSQRHICLKLMAKAITVHIFMHTTSSCRSWLCPLQWFPLGL